MGRRADPGGCCSRPGHEAQKRETEHQQCPPTWAQQPLLWFHAVRVATLTSTPPAQSHCSEGLQSWLGKRPTIPGWKGEAEIFAQLQRLVHETSLLHEGERHRPGVGSQHPPPSAVSVCSCPISAFGAIQEKHPFSLRQALWDPKSVTVTLPPFHL